MINIYVCVCVCKIQKISTPVMLREMSLQIKAWCDIVMQMTLWNMWIEVSTPHE